MTCPECGKPPKSVFNIGGPNGDRFALWCASDHRWEADGYVTTATRLVLERVGPLRASKSTFPKWQ